MEPTGDLTSSEATLRRAADAAPPRTLVDVFTATVAAYPEEPALDDGITLTYVEVRTRVDELARQLQELGVGKGARVGIRLTSGTNDLYIAILAVLHAGAAYVPVDADDPPERADLVFSEAGVAAVIRDGPEVEVTSATATGHRPRSTERRRRRLDHLHLGLHRGSQGGRRHPSLGGRVRGRRGRALRRR